MIHFAHWQISTNMRHNPLMKSVLWCCILHWISEPKSFLHVVERKPDGSPKRWPSFFPELLAFPLSLIKELWPCASHYPWLLWLWNDKCSGWWDFKTLVPLHTLRTESAMSHNALFSCYRQHVHAIHSTDKLQKQYSFSHTEETEHKRGTLLVTWMFLLINIPQVLCVLMMWL
jgi:hypothetical protein